MIEHWKRSLVVELLFKIFNEKR